MNTLLFIIVLVAIGFLFQSFMSKKVSTASEEEKLKLKEIVEKSDAGSRKVIMVILLIIILVIIFNNLDLIKDKIFTN
jgi:Na+/H+ antiporter NhaC